MGAILSDLTLGYVFLTNGALINRGISFGWLANLPMEGLLLLQIIGILLLFLISLKEENIGYWLMFCGAMTNLISRLIWGGVVDYINFYFVHNNLADLLITIGVCLILFLKIKK